MLYTENYDLKKPEPNDPADITALNSNYDIIDDVLSDIALVYKGDWFNSENINNLNDVNESVRVYTTSGVTGGLPTGVQDGAGGMLECVVTPTTNGAYAIKQTFTLTNTDPPKSWIRTKYCYSDDPSIAYDPLNFSWTNWTELSNLGSASVQNYTATIGTTWTGTSAPYTQTVSVAGITNTDTPIVDVVLSSNTETALAQLEAWGCVSKIETATNSITVTCLEDKPETSIPIVLKVVR